MIHYFNPGHETAVLNNSRYYRPAANQLKMQADLAYLPAWYARPADYVWVDKPLGEDFLRLTQALPHLAQAITTAEVSAIAGQEEVELWGISPQAIHQLNLSPTLWKDEYRELTSRAPARRCLSRLIDNIPEIDKKILPVCHSQIASIEESLRQSTGKQLLKSPYSSSGRGLVWLPPGELARSEKQIIAGMLKKQSCVSTEPALDKALDFSFHFRIEQDRTVSFLGYSLFNTNSKGAYLYSLLDSQQHFEEKLHSYIPPGLLSQITPYIIAFIGEEYAPYYTGNIGVDMLIYQDEGQYRLHPCVEINMRKSMGYLSLRLYTRFVHPQSRGAFYIDYYKDSNKLLEKHNTLMRSHPLVIENGRICSGYMPLCSVEADSNYWAYLLIK